MGENIIYIKKQPNSYNRKKAALLRSKKLRVETKKLIFSPELVSTTNSSMIDCHNKILPKLS